jgi:hypothetical protein
VGALIRLQNGIERQKEALGSDTLPDDHGTRLAPAPPAVIELAARCSAPFTGATVPVHDLHDLTSAQTLFLAAGRDSDAATVVARRLAAISPKDTSDQSLDSAVQVYVTARPVRFAAAETLLVRRARGRATRAARLKAYAVLVGTSNAAGDTAYARAAAQRIVTLVDSLTPAERQSDEFEQAGSGAFMFVAMKALVGLQPRLDSLRKSTAAYVALERAYWTQMTRERGDAIPNVGKQTQPIPANYWFPAGASTVAHPTPGRATLIVLMRPTNCLSEMEFGDFSGWTCDGFLAELRRIARRFPALKIDIVVPSTGAFMYVPPPAPADEAALLAKWLDAVHVPGAVLGVIATPFLKVAEPDGRRVDQNIPIFDMYAFQKTPSLVPTHRMFLVDADGIVVEGEEPFVGAWDEDELMQIIDALLQQRRTGN